MTKYRIMIKPNVNTRLQNGIGSHWKQDSIQSIGLETYFYVKRYFVKDVQFCGLGSEPTLFNLEIYEYCEL